MADNQDDLITSDDPQNEMAARGQVQVAKALLDSGPRTQDSIEPDYNSPVDLVAGGIGAKVGGALARDAGSILGNEIGAIGPDVKAFYNAAEAASAGDEASQLAMAQHMEGLSNGSIPLKPQGGLVSNPNLNEQVQNQVSTSQKGQQLYRDQVAAANKASRRKMADGGVAGEAPPEGIEEFAGLGHNDNIGTTLGHESEPPEGIYEFAGLKSPREEKYGTTEQQLKTFGEGAAEGVAGPLATYTETALGVNPEDIRGRREENPITHGVGQVAGLAGSLATGVGEGALAARAAEAIAPVAAESVASRLVSAGVKAAIENMVIQSGDEISKKIINDPNQSAETAISDVGLAGVLGGVIGGGAASISPLWRTAFGNKSGQLVSDFKGRMIEHYANPDPIAAATEELTQHYNELQKHASEVYGAEGLKARDVEKALPQVNPKMVNHATETSIKIQDTLDKMLKDEYKYPRRLTAKLEADLGAYNAAAVKPEASASDIFNATQDLKNQLQSYSKFDKMIKPTDDAYDFTKTAKSLAHDLREQLEDHKIFGEAAKRQQAINSAFKDYLPKIKDFNTAFTKKIDEKYVIDPGKVATFLNQVEKPSGQSKIKILENYLGASDRYMNVISDTHHNLGIDSPIQHTSLSSLKYHMGEKTPGRKLADYFINKGSESTPGEFIKGTAIGAIMGHPHIGGLLGASSSVINAFKSAIPGLIKPFLTQETNSIGAKSAIDYAMNVVAGDNAATKAAKSVFKGVGMSSGQISHIANRDSRMRDKLDKQLQDLQKDPSPMEGLANNLGHYLPDHSTALAQSSMNAVNYLNGLRPGNVKLAPLDSNIPPSSSAKSRYNNALDIANKPAILLNKISDGTITPDNIKDLKTLYPQYYNSLASKLMEQMTDHISKGDTVPYKTRLGLSMFLGQGMDSTITPTSILSAQPRGDEKAPIQDAVNPNRRQKNTKPLSKAAGQYRTPGQKLQLDQQTKD